MTDRACGRARRALWPDQGPRPASPEVIAAQEHVRSCPACAAFFAEQRALSSAVAETAAQAPPTPHALRRRMLAVAAGRPRRRRLAPVLATAAAIVLIAGAAGLWQSTRGVPEREVMSLFTSEHQRLVAGGGITSGDAAEITRWFAGRVDFAMRIPDFSGATLKGGRLCMAEGHRGAIVEYELDGHMVSYFVVPVRLRGGRAADELRHAAQAGYRVVWWTHGDLLHAIVGDLPPERLTQLARWCQEQWGGQIMAGSFQSKREA